MLEVLGVGSGEGSYIQKGNEDSLSRVLPGLASATTVYAVYKPQATPAQPGETPPGTYVVVTHTANGGPLRLQLDGAGMIIYISFTSAPTAAEIVARDRPTEFLVPPAT